MSFDIHAALLVAVMAIVTALLRFAPFLIFRDQNTPAYVLYLGRVLPYAIMGMLVVYCLRETDFTASPFGLPELAAGAVVVLLHVWKRNTLVSILGGTALYMLLLRLCAAV